MTPALLARIQPSPEDRVAPWQLSAILEEAKAALDNRPLPPQSRPRGALPYDDGRLCERCKVARRIPGKHALYCRPCGITSYKEGQRRWWHTHKRPGKSHKCFHCPTMLLGARRVCDECYPKTERGRKRGPRPNPTKGMTTQQRAVHGQRVRDAIRARREVVA